MECDHIETNKANALANHLRKKEEAAAQAIQASIHKQNALEAKLQKAAEIQARKSLREAAKQMHKVSQAQTCAQKTPTKPKKASVACCKSVAVVSASRVVAEPKVMTTWGRAVKQPAKLLT